MQFEFTVHLDGGEHDVLVLAPAPLRVSEVWPRLLGVLGSSAQVRPDIEPDVVLGSRRCPTGSVLRAVGEPGPARGAARSPDAARSGDLAVHVVGGCDAGRSIALRPGPTRVGRDVHNALVLRDERVSRHHVTIRAEHAGVTLYDDTSTNGTTIEGSPLAPGGTVLPAGAIARIGDTLLSVHGPSGHGDDETPLPVVSSGDRHQVAPVSRPPDPAPIVLDVAETARRAVPRPTQWLAAVVPAVAGGALAWFTHSPTFLLFALLSPVMLLGTALGDRIHWRRSRRADDAVRRTRDAVDDRAVTTALQAETAIRRARHPDPVLIARAATVPTTRLWQRRRADDDMLALRLGTAAVQSSTRVRRDGDTEPAGRLLAVPITVDLRDGPLGIAGPPDVLDGLARNLVAQLAVLHPPGILELALFLSDAAGQERWWWARWLPQLGDRVARSGAQWRSVAERIAPADGRWTVVVLDRAAASTRFDEPARFDELARLVSDVRRTGVTALVFGGSETDLPSWCVSTIDLWARRSGDAEGTKVGTEVGTKVGTEVGTAGDIVIDQVGTGWAEQVARSLAALSVATGDAAGIPDRCHLLDVLDFETPTRTEVVSRWAASDGHARTLLGSSADGRLELDLERDGPHLLVAGTTGSGKSELLRTLVLGLALQHPPDELSFVLIDYKGGAAFAACSDLPHVVGSVTDLDAHLTRRALQSLEAELRRRERLFADAAVSDLEHYRRTAGSALARLVIVVDEFAALADTLPDVLRGLVSVAQRGRSLGLHLVLATQRPGTAVTPEIRANTACRIALRVIEAAESSDIIGLPDAARLSPRLPGRALMSRAGSPIEFQTAGIDGVPRARSREVAVELLGPWRQRQSASTATAAGPSAAQLVRIVGLAAADRGVAPGAGPWLTPLPALLTARSLTASGPHRVPLGLIDRPAEQRQDTLEVDLDRPSSWLVVGGPRSGRTSTLLGAALAAATAMPPTELEIYVIDGAGSLAAALRDLPHVATCLGPDELIASALLVRRLAGRAPSSARVVLLIDQADRVLNADEDAANACAGELTAVLNDRRATVLAAGSRALLPARVVAGFEHRLVLRLPDRADYALAGVSVRDVPADLPPGRAVRVSDGTVVQVAFHGHAPGTDTAAAVIEATAARWHGRRSDDAVRIRALPRTLDLGTLPAHPGTLRLGVAGEAAEPVHLDPFAGSGRWLVAGPARSGRTTTLLTLLAEARRIGLSVLIAAPARSALHSRGREIGVETLDPSTPAPGGPPQTPTLVLVDDCESFADSPVDDTLALWARGTGALCFVVAGRSDDFAASYRGLAAEVRRARSGLLLRPGPLDGELFDVRLPRATDPTPGRGVLVGLSKAAGWSDGTAPTAVQVARP